MADPTILVIDDNAERRTTLTDRLTTLGYAVSSATSGREALDLLARQRYDVVLLEIGLWGLINSYQLLERMRLNGVLATTPVLVLAPSDNAPGIERFLEMGASDYLSEPFLPALLKQRLAACRAQRRLAEHQQQDEQQEALLKIERDVQIARQIQLGFLPSQIPQPDGWEIVATFHPAREVAGDFFDVFMLTQNRRVGFVIADVCDKGVGAALFMSLSRSLIRAFAQQHYSISGWTDVLSDMGGAPAGRRRSGGGRASLPSIGAAALKNAMVLTNNYITDNHLEMNMFVTVFFGVLDPATGTLLYANGGHCEPLIVNEHGVKQTLEVTGPAIGMLPGVDFGIAQAQLEPGDTLFCYSDGVTDARDPARKFFGEERMFELLGQPVSTAAALIKRFEATLQAHIASADQFDDITMLAVRRAATDEPGPQA